MKGTIFDIKKFAVHDGPGIRSTVFLKGCPLRCLWCQNPEGLETTRHLWYFQNRCIKCLKCVNSCPSKALSMGEDDEPFIRIDRDSCNNAGSCVAVCPTNALTFDSREVDVNEIVETLLEDLPFYRQSGGGITLSGGDPTFQSAFSLAILKACKEKGLHTAIETSMFVKTTVFQSFFDVVDTFIVDIKLFDRDAHQEFIGQDNQLILDNFKILAKTKKDILVRIPIIPGITDTEDNLQHIAEFVSKNSSNIPIELINYNPFADNKYRLMHKEYKLAGTKPLENTALESLYKIIEAQGITVIRSTDTKD